MKPSAAEQYNSTKLTIAPKRYNQGSETMELQNVCVKYKSLHLNKCKSGYLITPHMAKYTTEHAHPCD